eukprot:286395_1
MQHLKLLQNRVLHRCFSSTTQRIQCDALIVGAGIAGTSVGYELANNHGLNVIILEQEYCAGYHSTGRAAGLFAENYGTDSVKLLTMASRDWFENPPLNCNPNIAEYPILTPAGTLFTSTPECQDIMLTEHYGNTPCADQLQVIDTREAQKIFPFLNYDDPTKIGAFFIYDAYATALDVANVHQSYLKGLKNNNASIIYNQQVNTINKCNAENINWEITTNLENSTETKIFESRILINAAGAWADHIAIKAGLQPLGIKPMRRCLVIFKPHNELVQASVNKHIDDKNEYVMPWTLGINEDGNEFWYIGPQGKSGLLLCSPANKDMDEACDAQATDLEIAICIDRIETYTQCRIKKIEAKWAGLRCYSNDENFIIGNDPNDNTNSFYWCAGLAGQGIQAAPGYSQMLAHKIVGKEMPKNIQQLGFDIKDVLPHRFVNVDMLGDL